MRIQYLFIGVSVSVILTSPALADKRADFRAAADIARRGIESCDTLPYSDLESPCENAGREKDKFCDGASGPVSCEANVTGQLRTRLVTAERTLSDLRDEKYKLESSKSSASDDAEKSRLEDEIRRVTDKISDADKEIVNARQALDQRRRDVETAIYNIDKCIDARKSARYTFDYALDRMRTEYDKARNDPNAEIDAADAEVLKEHYEKSKKGHEIQITGRENARGTCYSERP